MRIPALAASGPLSAALSVVLVASSVAGCSQWKGTDLGHALHAAPTSSGASTTTSSPTSGKAVAPTAVPGRAAPISEVIAWIEAGHPADPGHYHGATRDGVTTPIGADVAFTGEGGKTACTTDTERTGATLDCLINLTSPPPRPETAYGQWIGGWTTFDGVNLRVGAALADPGPFVNGNGAELANGDTLAFGDYRCRADQAGLFCVNYAHQSAARFGSAGVEPYGCLKSVPAPDGTGVAFSCS